MILLIFLLTLLFNPRLAYNPPITENVKMVMVWGMPETWSLRFGKGGMADGNMSVFDRCMQDCWEDSSCILVHRPSVADNCKFFLMPHIHTVIKLNADSEKKVAFKMTVPNNECPDITEDPPLFGNPSASLIGTGNLGGYYKSQFTETEEGWKFDYSVHKCTTDFPEPSSEGDITDGGIVIGDLQEGVEIQQFTISFFQESTGYFPMYLKIHSGKEGLTKTEISTWSSNDDRTKLLDDQYNPLKPGDEFKFRINSSETTAFIYINDAPVIEYELDPNVPLKDTTSFVINFYGETVIKYFLGWTGDFRTTVGAVK